jgi:hypothetical protein
MKSLRRTSKAQKLHALNVASPLGLGTGEKTGFAEDVMKKISGS